MRRKKAVTATTDWMPKIVFSWIPGWAVSRIFAAGVQQAHHAGFSVVTFQNLGYSSVDAPQFLKAEDDVRAGRDTVEKNYYFWSKTQRCSTACRQQ